jgi:hypothetical protein
VEVLIWNTTDERTDPLPSPPFAVLPLVLADTLENDCAPAGTVVSRIKPTAALTDARPLRGAHVAFIENLRDRPGMSRLNLERDRVGRRAI